MSFLTGCLRTNISRHAQYEYLKDFEYRHKDWGEKKPMTIKDAEFNDGSVFRGQLWNDMTFKNCVFSDTFYLGALVRVNFEDCMFDGANFQSDDMMEVHFLRCKTSADKTWYIMNNAKSRNVLFEECQFLGQDDNDNHWGGVDFVGEMTFKNCFSTKVSVASETKVLFQDSKFDTIMMRCGHYNENRFAVVTIQGCSFKNKFDMSSTLESLLVKDTTFEQMDLSEAIITKGLEFQNIKGGFLNILVDNSPSLIMRNVELTGTKLKSSTIRSLECTIREKIQNLTMENVKCAFDQMDWHEDDIEIGNCITCGSIKTFFKSCVLPNASIDLHNSEDVEFENVTSENLRLKENVGKLHFVSGCEVSKLLSFTNIKAKEVDLRGMHIDPKAKLTIKDTNFAELEKEGKYLVQKKK
jgi:uncharacterized protein YjbI with pentapeptide repeats